MRLAILECFLPFNDNVDSTISCQSICIDGSKALLLCGALFDIQRKLENAARRIALNKNGSESLSQAIEMGY